mgnify:FL=1
MRVKPVNDPALHSFLSVTARYLGVADHRGRAPRPAKPVPFMATEPLHTRPSG